MKEQKKINQLLSSLHKKNQTEDIFLNIVQNEFIVLKNKITVPRIPVKELDYPQALDIVTSIADYIPEFLNNHAILKEKKPASEQHWLHFIQRWQGKLVDFVHLFKIDLKFGGDPSNIIEKGNTNFYPSYSSNRIYYKSRLIPESKKTSKKKYDFQSLRLKDVNLVESDDTLFTSSIFDELDTKNISIELCSNLPSSVFSISPKVYPFITYDYFTSCLNILNPVAPEIEKAITIFEPLFIFIYSIYHRLETLTSLDKILTTFPKEISLEKNQVVLTPEFTDTIHQYFHRCTLYTDEQLALHGRKRVDISL